MVYNLGGNGLETDLGLGFSLHALRLERSSDPSPSSIEQQVQKISGVECKTSYTCSLASH
jgi:hypothetical protein